MRTYEVDNPRELTDDEAVHINAEVGERLAWTARQTCKLANEGKYKGSWSNFVEDALKTNLLFSGASEEYHIPLSGLDRRYVDQPSHFESILRDYQEEKLPMFPNSYAYRNLEDGPLADTDELNLEFIRESVGYDVPKHWQDLPLEDLTRDSPIIDLLEEGADAEEAIVNMTTHIMRAMLEEDLSRRDLENCLEASMK